MKILMDVEANKIEKMEVKMYDQCYICQRLHKGKCINENDCVITQTLEMLSNVLFETRKSNS